MKITHAEMVHRLIKSGAQIKDELTADDCGIIHAALGIAGEAGEIVDAVKKAVVYRKPLDIQNIKEELGDMEFYMEDLRQRTGLTRDECIQANMTKLEKRYPGFNYSDNAAKERADKAAGILNAAASCASLGLA